MSKVVKLSIVIFTVLAGMVAAISARAGFEVALLSTLTSVAITAIIMMSLAWALDDPPAPAKRIDDGTSERDSARALLGEAVPHIKRALSPYKDGWIEEKQDILARITAELEPKP